MLNADMVLWAAVVLMVVALVLMVHHCLRPHKAPLPPEDPFACGPFQPRALARPETWILVCCTNALSLSLVAAAAKA